VLKLNGIITYDSGPPVSKGNAKHDILKKLLLAAEYADKPGSIYDSQQQNADS